MCVKRNWMRLAAIGIATVLFLGCPQAFPADPEIEAMERAEPASAAINAASAKLAGPDSLFAYKYGLSAAAEPAAGGWDKCLSSMYAEWYERYVTSSAASGYKRVKRDKSSDYDTVSEGQAYGMLIAAYMNDFPLLKNLWKYALMHSINATTPLMHWKVDQKGRNVSEFKQPVPHGPVYLDMQTWLLDTNEDGYITDNDRKYELSQPDPARYLKASSIKRTVSSAADADFDMAAALIIAYYKTFDPYYKTHALNILNAINENDLMGTADGVEYEGLVRNGSTWGSVEYWNPSYYAPAWFRLYIKFLLDCGADPALIDSFEKALETTSGQLDIALQNGLPPDWCDTKGGTLKESEYGVKYGDRIYWFDENLDGKPDKAEGEKKRISYNFYYDAIRTPWRLAVDCSWYGDNKSWSQLDRIRRFFNERDYGTALVDGYQTNGARWDRKYRDGFNNIKARLPDGTVIDSEGGSGPSVTFYAMSAPAYVVDTNNSNGLNVAAKNLLDRPETNATFNYYGNTLRLLSMLYLSGRFVRPYTTGSFLSEGNGKFISSDKDGYLYAMSATAGTHDGFELYDAQNGYIRIKSPVFGSFVKSKRYNADLYRVQIISSDPLEIGTSFRVESQSTSEANYFALKANWGGRSPGAYWRYVCADADLGSSWPLAVNRDAVGAWERFRFLYRQ